MSTAWWGTDDPIPDFDAFASQASFQPAKPKGLKNKLTQAKAITNKPKVTTTKYQPKYKTAKNLLKQVEK